MSERRFDPIAIVGRGCVLPGARTPDALVDLAIDARCVIDAAPLGRWRIDPRRAHADDPKRALDRAYSDRGGYVEAQPAADAIFAWTRSAGRDALAEARLLGGRHRGGAIVGNLMFPTAAHAAWVEQQWCGEGATFDESARFHSGRVAFDLARALQLDGGPSFCLDAACASSLYAIALACDALHDDRADVMVAGAVNCTDDLFIHIGFSALGALSPSGRSRPFHPRADGLVPAEGAALVALMRLDDAIAQDRPVFGVIRAVGLANDGRAKSFLAPSANGQARAMERAYAQSGVAPRDVGWVECHATGTAVGDATELASMQRVFEGARDVPIGSLKANLGHLVTAAGAAGLLKVLGLFARGVRPATPHLDDVDESLAPTPLRVVRAPEPWTGPKLAAVSAFGFGGNDAHLIVETFERRARPAYVGRRESRDRIAVVGIGARVGSLGSAAELAAAIAGGAGNRRANEVSLPIGSMRSPPSDLALALGQQTLVLAAALDAWRDDLDPARTSALIAIECDPAIARYGVRWRRGNEDAAPPLVAAGVLGTMPNIPANRLNQQFDLAEPSFVVAAEGEGGFAAVRIAERMLATHAIDAALVGATDAACDPLHEAALAPGARGGDAAIVLALVREADARARGQPILALIASAPDDAPRFARELAQFGDVGAATGMLRLAAAVLECAEHSVGQRGERRTIVVESVRFGGFGVVAAPGPRAMLAREHGGPQLVLPVHAPLARASDAPLLPAPPLQVVAPLAPQRGVMVPAPQVDDVDRQAVNAHVPPVPSIERIDTTQTIHSPSESIARRVVRASDAVAAPRDAATSTPATAAERVTTAHPLAASASSRSTTAADFEIAHDAPVAASASSPSTTAVVFEIAHDAPVAASASSPSTTAADFEIAHDAPVAASTSSRSTTAAELVTPSRRAGGTRSSAALGTSDVAALVAHQRSIADIHRAHLETQSALHAQFLAGRARAATLMSALAALPPERATRSVLRDPRAKPLDLAAGGARVEREPVAGSASGGGRIERAPVAGSAPGGARSEREPVAGSAAAGASATDLVTPPPRRPTGASMRSRRSSRGLEPATPPPVPRGPTFSKDALRIHSSGRISSIFGPAFEPQDAHAVQVRMPEPPLLLADRVTGLAAEPASMGRGTVWTETDVDADAWYLTHGRMPAGVMIESGQADLFLISYLGADLLNRGERRYRLLGCTLTWHRSPPAVGETLAYDIHVDGHANQGEVRLFFFHYDCHIGGRPALTVRDGQAGFFTQEELQASAGVLWSPEEQTIAPDARVDPPRVELGRTSFDREAIAALTHGDLRRCFGDAFAPTAAHVRTPKIAGGHMQFFDEVERFEPGGGPWKRGYLRATRRIQPDDWFFRGHFHNDPCMPGTLMLEGCLDAMAFYLIGLGFTIDRDGDRFEPVCGEAYKMICRGQVTPQSRELVYELFVEEVHDGPAPMLFADLLCTVDGLKAFHARRFGLALVRDFPIAGAREQTPDRTSEPVAELDGVRLDKAALLQCAWGRPSLAFGPRYATFDGPRRAPRLPGPPLQLIDRVPEVRGQPWTKKAGASIVAVCDVRADAWYLRDGASDAMPFALLLEAALQPCGWLATYVGSALDRPIDLRFRNLDGTGEVFAEVREGTLRTEATLTSISDTASMVIVSFDVVVTQRETAGVVAKFQTVFGFFPDAAFANQAGLSIAPSDRALRDAEQPAQTALDHPLLPRAKLALLDAVPYCDPSGGRAGLGAARAENAVDPSAWYFRAHFFQDPVQPGSLGLEAMLALLRVTLIEKGLAQPMVAPRFAPIAPGAVRWKYRGQVLPTDRATAITLEITALEPIDRGVRARAQASFWLGDKRIYEATIAIDLVDDGDDVSRTHSERDAVDSSPSSASQRSAAAIGWPRGEVPIDAIGRHWREALGIGGTAAEALYLALLARFVRRVEASDRAERVIGRPALYACNHQTAIETLMLSMIAGAATGVPLVTIAKAEHRDSWLGRLLAWFFAHPSARLPELTAYFDRADPATLPRILREVEGSILLHVEGTRALSARQPIGPISGVPIEIAIERSMPIVPVRFTGGLPVAPLQRRLDFPVAMGRQDVWIGAPIEPRELAVLAYADRARVVRDAIESLGPREDHPLAPDPEFAAAVARAMQEHALDLPHAVLRCVLDDTAALAQAERDPWQATNARRLAL